MDLSSLEEEDNGEQEQKKRERRVRSMLKTFYGSNGKLLEADDDPTSVDSMAFDIDQYFNEVLRGQDLVGLHNIIKKLEQGMYMILSRSSSFSLFPSLFILNL